MKLLLWTLIIASQLVITEMVHANRQAAEVTANDTHQMQNLPAPFTVKSEDIKMELRLVLDCVNNRNPEVKLSAINNALPSNGDYQRQFDVLTVQVDVSDDGYIFLSNPRETAYGGRPNSLGTGKIALQSPIGITDLKTESELNFVQREAADRVVVRKLKKLNSRIYQYERFERGLPNLPKPENLNPKISGNCILRK